MTEVIKEQELIVRIRESSRIKIDLLENGESIFGPVLWPIVYDSTNIQDLKKMLETIDTMETVIRGIKITDNSRAAIDEITKLFFDSQKNAGSVN